MSEGIDMKKYYVHASIGYKNYIILNSFNKDFLCDRVDEICYFVFVNNHIHIPKDFDLMIEISLR